MYLISYKKAAKLLSCEHVLLNLVDFCLQSGADAVIRLETSVGAEVCKDA